MTTTIHAIFENGMFRRVESVALPEHTSVEIDGCTPDEPQAPTQMPEGLAGVYVILGERYDSGISDTTAQHNEHQP